VLRVRWLLAGVAAIYLSVVVLDASGVRLDPPLPRPFLYFGQIAALFPHSAPYAIEFRAELYFCDEKKYHEVDATQFFPGHEDDKENRFARAMFFYSTGKDPTSAKVRAALADYIIDAWNGAHPDKPVGGAMLFSLRLPIPQPGEDFPRYRPHIPARELKDAIHKFWFTTHPEDAEQKCATR
jgi:hypothetical protein